MPRVETRWSYLLGEIMQRLNVSLYCHFAAGEVKGNTKTFVPFIERCGRTLLRVAGVPATVRL
jgi:hypothetical protein